MISISHNSYLQKTDKCLLHRYYSSCKYAQLNIESVHFLTKLYTCNFFIFKVNLYKFPQNMLFVSSCRWCYFIWLYILVHIKTTIFGAMFHTILQYYYNKWNKKPVSCRRFLSEKEVERYCMFRYYVRNRTTQIWKFPGQKLFSALP